MYLHISLIQCCRYLCGNRCICKTLIFSVTDALFLTNVSATCFSSNLQILLSLPVMYNCIYILPFLGFKDTPFANFASTSHIFDNVKMLPSKITHLQLAFSKFCIFNSKNPLSQISSPISFALLVTSQLEPIHYLQKNWYKKFERIWSERWRHLEREFLC